MDEAQRRYSVPVGEAVCSHGHDGRSEAAHFQRRTPRFNTIQAGKTHTASEREVNLDEEVLRCESLLSELEEAATAGKLDCDGTFPERWRRANEILQKLAADSLEGGCSRDVSGAMEAYDHANCMFDRMATLCNQPGVASRLGGQTPAPISPRQRERRGGEESLARGQDRRISDGLPAASERPSRQPSDGHEFGSLEACVGQVCQACVRFSCGVTCGCLAGLQAAVASQTPTRSSAQQLTAKPLGEADPAQHV